MPCRWLPGLSLSRARRDEGSYQYGPDDAQRRILSMHQTWYVGSVSSERKAFHLYSSTESWRTPCQFSHQHHAWWGYNERGGEYWQRHGIVNQTTEKVWSSMAGCIPQTIEAHSFVNDSRKAIDIDDQKIMDTGIVYARALSHHASQRNGTPSIELLLATELAGHFHVRWS